MTAKRNDPLWLPCPINPENDQRLPLASRTVEGGTAGKDLAADQAATALAHLPFTTVDSKLTLKIACFATTVNIIRNVCTPTGNGPFQHLPTGLNHPFPCGFSESPHTTCGLDASSEKDFIRIDISNAYHHSRIHEEILNRPDLAPGPLQ